MPPARSRAAAEKRQFPVAIVVGTVLAAIAFAFAIFPLPRIILASDGTEWESLTPLLRYQIEASLRSALVQGVAGILLVLGAITTFRQYGLSRQQAYTERSARFVDAFTKAVEQLVSKSEVASIAGIYALERLADASGEDRQRIVEILSAFVRSRVGTSTSNETAIGALSRQRQDAEEINLSGAFLHNARLHGLDLRHFRFDQCDLRDANFLGSSLQDATFTEADLSRTRFTQD